MRRIDFKDNYIRYGLACLLFLFCSLFLMNDWLPRYPDPFGYLSNGAALSGYNWQSTTNLIQRMYAAGYSFILIPFFYFCKSFFALSKCIYLLNISFLIVSYIILCLISDFLLKEHFNCKTRSLICFGICLYPSNLYNIYTVTPEILSLMITCIIIYLIVLFNDTTKMKYLFISAIFVSVFPLIHSRELVILCAFFIYIFYLLIIKKIEISNFIKIIMILVMGLLLYKFLNAYVSENILGIIKTNDVQYAPNSFGSQVSKLKYLLSFDGIKRIIKNIISQTYYIQTSSLGLFLFGFLFAIKKTFECLFKNNKNYFYIFIFLCMSGMILLSAFFFINPTRFDHLVYGRHIETILPIIILVSFKSIKEIKGYINIVICILITMFMSLITYKQMINSSFLGSIPRTICGWDLYYDKMQENYIWILIVCALTLLSIIILILNNRYPNLLKIYTVIIIFVWGLTSFSAIHRELQENNIQRAPFFQLTEVLNYDDKNIYTDNSNYCYLIQLISYNHTVEVIDINNIDVTLLSDKNYIIYTEMDLSNLLSNNFQEIDINLNGKGRLYVFGTDYINYISNLGYSLK